MHSYTPPHWRRGTWLIALFISLCTTATAAEHNHRADEQAIAGIEQMIQQGHTQQAEQQLKQLLHNQPKQYQAWFMLGILLSDQHRYSEAIHAFQQVILLKPKLAEPHNNLAVIYDEMGDYMAAVEELEASIKLNPDYITARENIGDLYVKLAADSYKQVLERGDNPEVRARYQRLLQVRGSIEESDLPQRQPASAAQHSTAAPTPPSQQGIQATIRAAIEAWRQAWSNQQLDAYFAAYDDHYKGAKFKSRAAWERYKRRVILKRDYIRVTLDSIQITRIDPHRMQATFHQHYRSDVYNSDDDKLLWFKQVGNQWKIVRESTLTRKFPPHH